MTLVETPELQTPAALRRPAVDEARAAAQKAENADVIVMRNTEGKYLMRSGNGEWVPYNY